MWVHVQSHSELCLQCQTLARNKKMKKKKMDFDT